MGPRRLTALLLCAGFLLAPLRACAEGESAEPAVDDAPRRQSLAFLEEYRRGLDGRRLRRGDEEALRALAESGFLHNASQVGDGAPRGIQFEAQVDGRTVVVRLSPGLEDAEQAGGLFQLGRAGSVGVFREDPALELARMPFFSALPSAQAAAAAPQHHAAAHGAQALGLLTSGLQALGISGAATAPSAVPASHAALPAPPAGDRFEVRPGDDATYLYRNGTRLAYRFEAPGGGGLFYAEGSQRVYNARGQDLGAYPAVLARMSGSGPISGPLFAGPQELRYTLRDGRLYAPDGRTVVGFVPHDPRYGSERVLFIHGDNTAGTASGTPWMVYSLEGQPLGRYEDVYARTVRDHDGNETSRVLVPGALVRGADGRQHPTYRTLDGKVFEGTRDAGGAETIAPFFTRQEQAQLDQLARLRSIEQMPTETALQRAQREIALRLAQLQMDQAFARRFPIVQHTDLTQGLPENLALALGEGGAAGAPGRLEALRRTQARYQAQLDAARRSYAEEAERTRERREALETQITAARQALESFRARTSGVISSANIEHERRLYDAQSRLESQLHELEGPLLTRADARNRLNAMVSDLEDQAQGLSPASGVPEALAGLRARRQAFDARMAEEAPRLAGLSPDERRAAEWAIRREFQAGMSGSEAAAFNMTQDLAALRANRAEAERVYRAYTAARAEADRHPAGSPERQAALDRQAALSRDRDRLVYDWRSLAESLDRASSDARSVHDGFVRLAALPDGAERARQEESLRSQLRLRPDADLAALSARWTGPAWDSHARALQYLSGVRAAQGWHEAIAERRAMFDAGVRMLMATDDPAQLRSLLRS